MHVFVGQTFPMDYLSWKLSRKAGLGLLKWRVSEPTRACQYITNSLDTSHRKTGGTTLTYHMCKSDLYRYRFSSKWSRGAYSWTGREFMLVAAVGRAPLGRWRASRLQSAALGPRRRTCIKTLAIELLSLTPYGNHWLGHRSEVCVPPPVLERDPVFPHGCVVDEAWQAEWQKQFERHDCARVDL
jgi:hypothetical protein